MTNTFETTLANITSQMSAFESSEEKAVEMFVVLPLLKQVGWNTENVSEIYPQRGLPDGGKVDFDLQIDGESRILIEVKRWAHDLNGENERQLADYCRSAKPKLAVLTSGHVWRLYLPPTAHKNAPLRRFVEFDITKAQLTEVESTFRRFLARDSMVNLGPTVAAARKLHSESQAYQKFKKNITKAWNELPDDKNTLTALVLGFAEIKDIPTSPDNVLRFLDSLNEPLVNEAATGTKSHKKPASFRLPASPTGKKKYTHTVEKRNGWNKFLLEFCEFMKTRHRDSFHQNILSMKDRFARSSDSKFTNQIGDLEIYAKKGNSREIRDACYEIVSRFGYPIESLEIRDSRDEPL